MRVDPIRIAPVPADPALRTSASGRAGSPESFGASLKSAVKEVNQLQSQADTLAQRMLTGDLDDVHQAIIAMNKASTAFQFAVQVRNKVIEAYQEIMRMQV